MSIPEEIIIAIKSRVNIVSLVSEHLPLKRIGANYAALCPFHEEKTPSFTVTETKGFYHCFGCGAHGDQIDWMVNYHGMAWHEAVARLAERIGVPLPENEESERIKAKNRVSKVLNKASIWMHEQLMTTEHARRYVVEERGVSPETANTFMIGWSPKETQAYLSVFSEEEVDVLLQAGLLGRSKDDGRIYPKLGGRVVFPIRDAIGCVIGFSGRAIGDDTPKYMNSPDSPFFSKRKEIFRPPEVQRAARRAGRLLVTEGYFDVVTLHASGFPYVVAGMGTSTTPENMGAMLSLADEVVFCFDGDKAGRIAAWKALITALPYIGSSRYYKGDRMVSFVFLPDGLDPDDFIRKHGKDVFASLIAKAMPLSQFFIESYRKKRDAEPMEKHAALITQAAKQIAQINDEVLRKGLSASLANIFDVSVEFVQKAGGSSSQSFSGILSRNPVIHIRPNALEFIFLANLLRRPWEVSLLPEDVELVIPGGTEIVSILRSSGITKEGEGSALEIFRDTPYRPLVERLLTSEDVDDNTTVNALRIELGWLSRKLDEIVKAATPDTALLRQLLSRKVDVQKRLEQAMDYAGKYRVP